MNYTIFGGVNGAGKSTLFSLLSKEEQLVLGERINVDELVMSKGNWQDEKLQILASKQTVLNIKRCIEELISFNQETTLAGKSILKTIKKAKAQGFSVHLNYVYVDSVETAKQRVAERVKKGGHGVSGELIEKRFVNSLENLRAAIPLCDVVNIFYNDTETGIIHMVAIDWGAILYKSSKLHSFIDDAIEV